MVRKRTRIPLDVFQNGRLVGQLKREISGAIEFKYATGWLNWEYTFPVSLSLPLREDRYTGDPVIAVFDNLLPDSSQVRGRLAERTKANGTDVFSLLTAIGRDCVGALQFLPAGADPGPVGEVRGRVASEAEIAQILTNLEGTPLGIDDDDEFRISLAGVQEKTALLYLDGIWLVPRGSTATTHILKPQIGQRGNKDLSQSVENEYLCMTLTSEFGLPTADISIEDFENQRALVVSRFDRKRARDGRLLRVPQEDCCQALSFPHTLKYQHDGGPGILSILEFLKASDDPQHDQRQFLKTQIVFWLLGATDGHAKNFSVFLYPGGGFRLTPLYDVMSTQPLLDAGQLRRNQMRLAMSAGNNRHYRVHDVLPRHYQQSAARAGVPEKIIRGILQELTEQVPRAIEKVRNELPEEFPETICNSIFGGMEQRMRRI